MAAVSAGGPFDDLTRQLRDAAGRLATSEEEALLHLRDVFDQLPAAVCLLRGPDHVFEFTNTRYRELAGDRPYDGLAVAEAMPEMREQGFLDLLDRVYRTGEQFVGREVRAVVLRDGRLEEVYVDFTYQPVRGADGGIQGILVHAFDVTEGIRLRDQLQDALRREQEDRFRQAINSMIDTVMIATPLREADGRIVDFRVTFVNSGGDEIGRRSPEQLEGRRFTELWPNFSSSDLFASYVEVVETGEPLVLERHGYAEQLGDTRIDGVFDIRATRLGDDLFLVWRDVTERVARDQALADSRARLAREREAVLMLQAAILPRELPTLPGAEVAAEYVAASEHATVGGDWFDVFALLDGTVAVSVGDVAGNGIDAAQIMVQVRSAGRVAALAGHDAAGVLASQNALMIAAGLGPFATALFAVYQPATGSLSWASAGHLPPVVVSSGRASLLTTQPGPPLGVVDDPSYPLATSVLGPGDRLVLYTDGLVERRGESIDEGIERLRMLMPLGGTAGDACRALLDLLDVSTGSTDDVCVLTLDRLSA